MCGVPELNTAENLLMLLLVYSNYVVCEFGVEWKIHKHIHTGIFITIRICVRSKYKIQSLV